MFLSFAVFKDENATRLFAGQLISQICDKMMTLGLVWVISGEGSLKQVPWFLAAGAIPHLFLSKSAGGWVGRIGPLKTVIVTDVFRGGIFLAAWAVWIFNPPGVEHLFWALLAITLLSNCASALFNPAILSLPMQLPLAKEGLIGQLTAMVDSCFSMGNILGPVVIAFLYPWLGLSGCFLLNALSYFLAALLEGGIRLAPVLESGSEGLAGVPSPGRVSFREDSLLHFMLGTFFVMNLVLTPMLAFLPLFARFQFQGNIGTLASMEAAIGLGTVAGSLGLTLVAASSNTGFRTIIGSLIISLMYLFFCVNHNPALACVALFVLGLSLSIVNISLLTLFQTRPDESDVPKVMSFVNLISVGALPFSMAMVGGLLEKVNLQALAISCASVLLGLSLLTALNGEFRKA